MSQRFSVECLLAIKKKNSLFPTFKFPKKLQIVKSSVHLTMNPDSFELWLSLKLITLK